MIVYRISKDEYASSLDGEGAFRFGGRWNSKGTRALYTSGSVALASLEVLVHTDGVPIRKGLSLVALEIPDDIPIEVPILPDNWDSKPAIQGTRELGDMFFKNKNSFGIKVPSVVIPEESNYILNPLHDEFSKINVLSKRPFVYDSRL